MPSFVDMELPPDDGGPDLLDLPPQLDNLALELPDSDHGEDLLPQAKRTRRRAAKVPVVGLAQSLHRMGAMARSCCLTPSVLNDVLLDEQLPVEVVTADLDDVFEDVVLVSRDKGHHDFVRRHRQKGMKLKKQFPGPSSSEVMEALFQCEPPCVVSHVPRWMDGTLQDDVCEIFSPPRVLEHTKKLGLRGDLSADLQTGWNLALPDHQANLLSEIHRRRPKLVFLEPPCTWFSRLLNMNWKKMPLHIREQGIKMAVLLLEFCFLIMRVQLLAGRAFLLEHPLSATSWTHPQVKDTLAHFPDTGFADFDFCMFGMVTKIDRVPVKKATRLMSNCRHVLQRFGGVWCDGTHDHVVCLGYEGGEKRSKYAQYYPDLFCSCLAQCSADFVQGVV